MCGETARRNLLKVIQSFHESLELAPCHLKMTSEVPKIVQLFPCKRGLEPVFFSQNCSRNQCKMNLESIGGSVDSQHGYVGSFVFLVHLVTLWFTTE